MSQQIITIPAKSIMTEPLVYTLSESTELVIRVGAGARATIVEELAATSDSEFEFTTKLTLEQGARVELVLLEKSTTAKNTVSRQFILKKDAELRVRSVLLGSAVHTEDRCTELQEPGARIDERECFFGSAQQALAMTTTITNNAPRTSATVLVKGVLAGSSRANYVGNMRITKAGNQSMSWLAQHILLLSKEAKADTLPCLEIEANDVQAYHAATVHALDDEHLFYLKTRGFTEEQAKQLLAKSILQEIIETITDSDVRLRIEKLVEQKWNGLYAKPELLS